jgi:hypothetical protein
MFEAARRVNESCELEVLCLLAKETSIAEEVGLKFIPKKNVGSAKKGEKHSNCEAPPSPVVKVPILPEV